MGGPFPPAATDNFLWPPGNTVIVTRSSSISISNRVLREGVLLTAFLPDFFDFPPLALFFDFVAMLLLRR
jgi:hypothetical protein